MPVFWLLTAVLNLGVTGIWWGIFFINWLAACISLLYIRKTMKELLPEE
jgi:Na+-driven multidrug efflux pump